MNKLFLPSGRRAVPALAIGLLALTGCATFDNDEPARQATQEREDVLLMQEQVRKVSGRLEGVELENQRLRTDFDNLKAAQNRGTDTAAALQAQRGELTAVEQRLRALESAREKDKQELVDVLSRKIELILSSGAGAGAPSGRKSGGLRKPPAHSGAAARPDSGGAVPAQTYEVKGGDTLSGIATAHNVKLRALLDANGLKDANHLRAGQKLNIPAP
jgi:LysM repeat protein